jgi:hypothetical protein
VAVRDAAGHRSLLTSGGSSLYELPQDAPAGFPTVSQVLRPPAAMNPAE